MQKIMFNERYGLQQATFDGTKTMTRRVVPDKIKRDALAYQSHYIDDERAYERYILDHAPYKVGEIVAVAQRYEQISGDRPPVMLRGELIDKEKGIYSLINSKETKGWSNKMFVKAEHMPRHIKMTSINVEGLAGISDEDCLKEGIYEMPETHGKPSAYSFHGDFRWFTTPYQAYKELIDRLNKRGFFESNPLVYAYTYEMVD